MILILTNNGFKPVQWHVCSTYAQFSGRWAFIQSKPGRALKMKVTGISRLCHLPTNIPSLSFRFCSNSVIHRTSFHNNKRNFHKFSLSATMEASFKPEEARVPAALPLPTPPVTKASSSPFHLHFFILDYQVAYFWQVRCEIYSSSWCFLCVWNGCHYKMILILSWL